jgi:hypothetical protein
MATSLDSYAPYDAGAGADSMEATWRAMMRRVLADGVIVGVTNMFECFADSTGLQVKVKSGECWIAGQWGQSTAQKTLPIAANALGITRGDRVVLRNDFGNNRIELDVLTGTTGTPPAVTQNTSIWEISIATVSVPNGDLSIDAAQVTDARVWTQTPGTAPTSVTDIQNTNGTTTSGSFTTTLTGGTACGVAFTAPASGRVLILSNCQVGNSSSPFLSLCSLQVRTGSVVGSGTIILAAANEESLYDDPGGRHAISRLVTGLTPGSAYNAQQLFAVTGGTGSFSNKSLTVVPA